MFEEGIEVFWAWWKETGRTELLAAVDGEESDIADVISQKIAELHPNLEWQLTPTGGDKYTFALSGGGSRVLRVLTETALRWAPVDDERIAYSASRVPVELEPFDYGNTLVDPTTIRVSTEIDADYEQLDIAMWIPGTGDIEEDDRAELAMYVLDAVLGEDGVERWVGLIDTIDQDERGMMALSHLSDAIAEYAPSVTGEAWNIYERGLSPKEPLIVAINVACKHIDHLTHGLHAEVRISLTEVTDLGMPSDEEADRVANIEDAVTESLGGEVLLVARETGLNMRILHFYGRDPDAMEDALTPFESHPTHDVEVIISIDPDWSTVAQLT